MIFLLDIILTNHHWNMIKNIYLAREFKNYYMYARANVLIGIYLNELQVQANEK